MVYEKHKGGRPRLTEAQKDQRKEYLLRKMEPYLKSGLSIKKALMEAKVHNSEFYKYLSEDEFFGEKIARYKQYISVLVNQALMNELLRLVHKQNGDPVRNIKPQMLSNQDINFLTWFAINSNACQEEWGRREEVSSFDPEEELQKLKESIQKSFYKPQQFVN